MIQKHTVKFDKFKMDSCLALKCSSFRSQVVAEGCVWNAFLIGETSFHMLSNITKDHRKAYLPSTYKNKQTTFLILNNIKLPSQYYSIQEFT